MKKKITISDIVLLVLEKAVDGYCRFEDFTYHHYRYHYGAPELKKSSLAVALKRLREQGYIDLEKYNEQLILKLTNKGKSEAILRKILIDEEWDGKWRVVIFDIPEKHRKMRNALRSKLKSWGFVLWQKSVWASKKNITQPLREFIKQIEIEQWVAVLESSDVGRLQFSVDRQ